MASVDTPARPISLEKGVLYITTSPLFSGGFHWALVHIDLDGKCSRHHWARRSTEVDLPERYILEILDQPRDKTGINTALLGYFKIPDCQLGRFDEVEAVCRTVFPDGGYPTPAENRRHGINCRTWVNGVVARLQTEERANEVEARVTSRSTTLGEAHAKAFLGLAIAPATVVEAV